MALGPRKRFDRYFEGYEKRFVTDSKGRERSKYVYTKNYYQPEITSQQFMMRKILFSLLVLAALGAQAYAGFQSSSAVMLNTFKYTAIFQCLGVLSGIAVIIYLTQYLFAGYKMEINTYRSGHEKLTIVSFVATIVLAAIFLFLLGLIIFTGHFTGIYILWASMYLISAACIAVLWYIEKHTDYKIVAPDFY